MNEEIRYRIERVPMTTFERLRVWWIGVLDAVKETPETHYSRWIQVRPGDFGYESAPFECHVDPHPMRWRLHDGEYVRVDDFDKPTETGSNPNWRNP